MGFAPGGEKNLESMQRISGCISFIFPFLPSGLQSLFISSWLLFLNTRITSVRTVRVKETVSGNFKKQVRLLAVAFGKKIKQK
jgi:hypothetical protein